MRRVKAQGHKSFAGRLLLGLWQYGHLLCQQMETVTMPHWLGRCSFVKCHYFSVPSIPLNDNACTNYMWGIEFKIRVRYAKCLIVHQLLRHKLGVRFISHAGIDPESIC